MGERHALSALAGCLVMEGEALLVAIDTAIDEAIEAGRIKINRRDPQDRELTRAIRVMDAPLFVLPREPQPPMTAVLVMDGATLRRLRKACCYYGDVSAGPCVEYAGVPIKVDDNADGCIYIVSLCPMSEAV